MPQLLPIDLIRPNPQQPRRRFDPEGLKRLAESLQAHGALQPIVVRAVGEAYELVAGERRLRAARLAGLVRIPVLLRDVAEDKLLEFSLVENAQRENLNAVEKARAYQVLSRKHGLSHEVIARRMGEDRSSVSHTIRLAELPDAVLVLLESGKLRLGHGKALLSLADSHAQTQLALRAARERWSVRRLEDEVRNRRSKTSAKTVAGDAHPSREFLDRLAAALRVKVAVGARGRAQSGFLQLNYRDADEMKRIVGWLSTRLETGR